jgi:glucose/arabinose dehydrogenase
MKESSGSDHLSVGWSKPGQTNTAPSEVIPGTQLSTTLNVDAQAPTAPSNLSAAYITSTTCILNWTAATDNIGVVGYDVYRNGVKINATTLTGTAYAVNGLISNTNYTFSVRAKDAAANETASQNLVVTSLPAVAANESFTMRTIIARQRMPHDIVYGPDQQIWYTERFGGTVSRVDPNTGVKQVLLSLGTAMVRAGGQDGLLGLALHPQLLNGKPFVYIMYTYESTSATIRKMRIQRYEFDAQNNRLVNPVTIQENIPGSNDHNSGRLAIGPDLRLYVTVGDMGAGQFDNVSRANNAQNLNSLEGKVLRYETELVNGTWIPANNPFQSGGLPTAIYTLGHRNAQGLVWGQVNGSPLLFSSEHGPFSDDEINRIELGRNYGWPQVAGFCDGNYNGRTIGGFAVINEQANCAALQAREPLRSIFPSNNPPTGGDNMQWPSMAPSGMDFYGASAIPGWQHSLLVAMLKSGTLTRYQLNADGSVIVSDTINYFRGMGRFRDVAVSADGLKIYLACDSSGSTSGPTGNVVTTPANPGSILEFTFQSSAQRNLITQTAPKLSHPIASTNSIDVYPNPARGFFNVKMNPVIGTYTAELIDFSGRLLSRQVLNNQVTTIQTKGIPSGTYIVKVNDAQGKMVKIEKLIIQQ